MNSLAKHFSRTTPFFLEKSLTSSGKRFYHVHPLKFGTVHDNVINHTYKCFDQIDLTARCYSQKNN